MTTFAGQALGGMVAPVATLVLLAKGTGKDLATCGSIKKFHTHS